MRRISATFLSIFCLFVLTLTGAAQQPALSPPGPSAPAPPTAPGLDAQSAAVLATCKTALGAGASAQILDSVIQATVSNPDNSSATPGTVTIKAKGTDMVRWEGTSGGKTYVTIAARGQQKHQVGSGWATDASANAIHQRMTHLPALLIGQEMARGDLWGQYVGQETLGGQTVHHVKLARVSTLGSPVDAQLTQNSEIDVFINTQTGLIAKIRFIHHSETDWRLGTPMEIYYDNYQTVNGMLIPYHQRTIISNSIKTDLNITSAQFNVGLADTVFQGN